MTEKQRVWDVPIRLFHWLLAGLIAFSWWSAENHHGDWHLWSGFGILTLLLFRILWGFFGSSTARFASFVRGPASVFAYLRGEWRGIGHSPLGALSVVAMLLAVAVQVGLGLVSQDEDGLVAGPLADLVGLDLSEQATDLHESFFYVLLGLIVLHLAALAYYRLVRRKDLISPMITGRAGAQGFEGMRPGKWWAALLCLAAAIAITRWIVGGAPPFGG
ncbi:Ni/Fe-hydrogenase 1 b-type cytochrome subunit [Sphingomonas sinipercae]|uniref:Ni/Fe-hydrogenase 1 b-type cytochrome subunit n=1 Tax=Sphingomonas sinipercae TaxID=2714944 RepID=A0A6G7ZMA2_9SPHN|nr:cytochrome b/b6 domain-containing protein [Sphingomonas sinipercae]QIL02026.1 Ni/Fe-hydrogenase 1 b-type cytochrome subunit [Sphingomonas sinipercae]